MEFLFNTNIQLYLASYLIGGIPFGLLLGKIFAGVDITESGSKSIGATNVLRVIKEKDPVLAKKLGAATLTLDALKGAAVLLVAKLLGVEEATLWGMGVVAILGHCFSPYLKFEGGKGVATGLGVVAVMLPLETLVALSVWLIVGKILKISSVSSLLGLAGMLAASYILHPELPGISSHAPLWIIAIIIFYKHIPNLIRLARGEEKPVL
ncbi:MAG: glycerol-3-phosphate 1-O-acyltransferase PlsY [Campylobacterales bacterium]